MNNSGLINNSGCLHDQFHSLLCPRLTNLRNELKFEGIAQKAGLTRQICINSTLLKNTNVISLRNKKRSSQNNEYFVEFHQKNKLHYEKKRHL